MSFLRTRWDQSARRLWYIVAFVHSRILSRRPKKTDEIRQSTGHRPAESPTTVVCTSRFPHPLTPIAGGDTPIASPTPISIQVRRPTILSPEDGYFLEGSGPFRVPRSLESPTYRPESIHVTLPPNQEDNRSDSPIIPPRPVSRYSGRSSSQHSVYRPQSQYSVYRPQSQYSHSNRSHLDGAEAAARGYLHGPPSSGPSSPAPYLRPPSIAGSVPSRVYRAPRPTTRVPRPPPMKAASPRRTGLVNPPSALKNVRNTPPVLPQPE